MVDFSGTFDTTNAMSGMFLWVVFGYLSVLLNCDLQRFLRNHPAVVHLFGVVAFFFLFTLLDSNNKTSIGVIWFKTFFVYLLFVLLTKSKWYFAVPVLGLLLLDQTLKKNVLIKEAAGEDVAKNREFQQDATSLINKAIIVLIVLGTLHYMHLQYKEYGSGFSLAKFFFGVSKCKPFAPKY